MRKDAEPTCFYEDAKLLITPREAKLAESRYDCCRLCKRAATKYKRTGRKPRYKHKRIGR